MQPNYITTIIGTQENTMSHIFSTSGLLAQAPAPSVATTTIIPPCWTAAKKAQINAAPQFKITHKPITLYT